MPKEFRSSAAISEYRPKNAPIPDTEYWCLKSLLNRILARVTAPAGNGHVPVLAISGARAVAPQVIESPTLLSPLPSALTDVNDWRVERELGRGGMATVYLARDIKHDRQVA